MVGSHGRGRWLEVVGGSGWPLVDEKVAENTQSRSSTKIEQGLFYAFVGSLAMVLVAAHGGGGVGGCWEKQVVAVVDQKWPRNGWRSQ